MTECCVCHVYFFNTSKPLYNKYLLCTECHKKWGKAFLKLRSLQKHRNVYGWGDWIKIFERWAKLKEKVIFT